MGIIVKCNNKHCILKVCEFERFACTQQYTSMNNSNSEYNYKKYVNTCGSFLKEFLPPSPPQKMIEGVGHAPSSVSVINRCASFEH